MDNELYHHGIKGQKWGVRRFQNKDGSLTNLGVQRNRATKAAKTKSDVDKIISTLNDKDRSLLGMEKEDTEYLSLDQGAWVVKRFLKKDGDTPVAFFDLLRDGDNLNVALATNSNYRGRGYSTELTKKVWNGVKNIMNIGIILRGERTPAIFHQ